MTLPFLPFYDVALRWPHAGVEMALFAVFVLTGLLTLLYAWPERNRASLAIMLVHAAGGLLALTAPDMIVLLLGWETMTFSAFFLLAQTKRRDALQAGWRYIVIHMASATLFFIGAIVHCQGSGSLAVAPAVPAAQPFFLAAILIKTAMIPMHVWLLDTYPKASYAGSLLLSIYTTKVGVFTAARIVRVTLFDQPVLALIGASVAVLAVIGALRQRHARRLLAWHIVSQIGFMLAGVGLAGAAANAQHGMDAGLFHAVNNVIYKSALLMVAGVVCRQFGHDDLYRMGGARRMMPITFGVAVVASAAIAGVPPLAGFASKTLITQAADNPVITGLLMLASIGTGLSFIKFVSLVFLVKPATDHGCHLKDPPLTQQIPMLTLAALCVINGLWPKWITQGSGEALVTLNVIGMGFIPVILAGVLWLRVSRKLLKKPTGVMLTPVVWPEKAITCLAPLLPRWRRWHAIHPQTAFMAVFAFWIALALWLGRS